MSMTARVAVEALDRLERRLTDARTEDMGETYRDGLNTALGMVRDLLDEYDRPRGGGGFTWAL